MDNDGTHTWSQLSALHRDLEAPTRGVGGDPVTHSRPPYPFPPQILFPSTYPLGDALLGRRKYGDPEVILDLMKILGPDDEVASEYIRHVRGLLVENYRRAFERVRELEMLMFGQNSYFLQLESMS